MANRDLLLRLTLGARRHVQRQHLSGRFGVFGALVFLAFPAWGDADIEPTLTAYCAHRVECRGQNITLATCLADLPDVERAAGVDDEGCDAFVALLLEHYQCQALLPCDELLDTAQPGCAITGARLLDALLTRGVGACFDGRPPVDPPVGWTCAAHYYNGGVGDGCDCGCGAIDRDCEQLGVVGCGEGGCTAAGCDFCYLDGDNVSCGGEDTTSPPPQRVPDPTPDPVAQPASCAAANLGTCSTAGWAFFFSAFRVRRFRTFLRYVIRRWSWRRLSFLA
jgi:hypothetical protein